MKAQRDPFRMDLRYAKLCMELDCNTVFDASTYRHCPTCGSVEFYPLESWLNRDRAQKAPGVETSAFPSGRRTRWLWRLRGARVASETRVTSAPVRLHARAAQRRRAG